jgi:tripartite-type tricarboxylate transporter receptor subunit TctC
MQRRTFCGGLGAAAAIPGFALAQGRPAYPSRPIRLVMPYPAGGGGDIVLRPLTTKLTEKLGQPFVIDYKPGASTMLGTEIVARAEPDGYTIGFITDSHVINPIFTKAMRYDAFADFSHISQLVGIPLVLVTHPSLELKTVPDLVAYAKRNPGKLAYASLGLGGPHYLAMEWFKHLAGIDLLHVPYSGSAPALTATVGNQVQLMFVGASTALQYARDGRLNALGATPAARLPIAPNMPSIAEAGYKEFDFTPLYGMTAPARTPPEIVSLLSTEIGLAMKAPDLSEKLLASGLIPAPSTPGEFTEKLRREAKYYENLVRLTGAKGA